MPQFASAPLRGVSAVSLCFGLVVASATLCRAQAQSITLQYEVDPTWPKPLPENWVTGQVSGVCADGQDHVFIVNRNDMTDKEAEVSRQAPPFIEFDADGKVVNSFGDWFSIVPVAKSSRASVARVISLASLPTPTRSPSIRRATSMWLRPIGA